MSSPRFLGADAGPCSFCSASTAAARLVGVAGKAYRVCDRCIDRCVEVLGEGSDASNPDLPNGVACSFCDDVVASRKKIVAAPTLYICDACVRAARAVL